MPAKRRKTSKSSSKKFILHYPDAIEDEAAKRYGRQSIRHNHSDDCEWTYRRYKPTRGQQGTDGAALESASVISIEVGPFPDMEMKIEQFPLVMEGYFQIETKECQSASDATPKAPNADPVIRDFNSIPFNCWLPPASGISCLFDRYEIFINGASKDEISSTSLQDFQSQVFIAAMDTTLCPDEADQRAYRANGLLPMGNNGSLDVDGLTRKLKSDDVENYFFNEAEAGAMFANEQKKIRTYFGKIPTFPASGMSNRDRFLCKLNNGNDPRLSPSEPTIPINTKLEFVFRKPPNENLLYKMYLPAYSAEAQSQSLTAYTPPVDNFSLNDWTIVSYVEPATADPVKPEVTTHHAITGIRFRYTGMSVAVKQRAVRTTQSKASGGKRSSLGCDIAASRALGQFFTAYRLAHVPIASSSLVTIDIPFDLPYPPNCIVLRFLRDAELLHNVGNQASYCPDLCSRPKNLTNLAFLVGHTVERRVYNNKEIDGLDHKEMTEKKHNWINGLVDAGFMSAERASSALEMTRVKSTPGTVPRHGVGVFNIFPISVRSDLIRDAYSYYAAGSTNIASTLRVEMKFNTEAVGPTGQWSLLAIASYLAKGTIFSDKETVNYELMF